MGLPQRQRGRLQLRLQRLRPPRSLPLPQRQRTLLLVQPGAQQATRLALTMAALPASLLPQRPAPPPPLRAPAHPHQARTELVGQQARQPTGAVQGRSTRQVWEEARVEEQQARARQRRRQPQGVAEAVRQGPSGAVARQEQP